MSGADKASVQQLPPKRGALSGRQETDGVWSWRYWCTARMRSGNVDMAAGKTFLTFSAGKKGEAARRGAHKNLHVPRAKIKYTTQEDCGIFKSRRRKS